MDHFKFCFLQYSNTEVISIITHISFITHISSKPSTDMTSAGIYGKFRPYNTTLLEPAPHPPHRRANEGVRFPITNGSLFANQNSRNQPPGKNFNVHNKGEILGRRGFRADIEKSNWNPAMTLWSEGILPLLSMSFPTQVGSKFFDNLFEASQFCARITFKFFSCFTLTIILLLGLPLIFLLPTSISVCLTFFPKYS